MQYISIEGARTHNLKNINVKLPRDRLIVITGLSGSGKSSLAFDTIYAEGQRRYVESLSSYARQFLSVSQKPPVDSITGLSPTISIEQKAISHNPRSTVGTITEIYDYLRLLYARLGVAKCPKHNIELKTQSVSQIVDAILALQDGTKLYLLSPIVKQRKGEHQGLLYELHSQGYLRVLINDKEHLLEENIKLNKNQKHLIEVVVDRLKLQQNMQSRLAESVETAIKLSDGLLRIKSIDNSDINLTFSSKMACPICGYCVAELEPRMFSFNNTLGACSDCDGIGYRAVFDINLIVAFPELSLANGAIEGWGKDYKYHFNQLNCVAKHYGFSTDVSWLKLSPEHQNIVLYGTKEKLHMPIGRYGDYRKFEGVLPKIERRYFETESYAAREEYAKYRVMHKCGTCNGQRLKEEYRNVFIHGKNLPSLCEMSIAEMLSYCKKINFEGSDLIIGGKILKEVNNRLSFLANVGLNYLTLSRSASTLSGGEGQRIRLASQIGAGLVGVTYVLDEPSIGLHQRDNLKLIHTLTKLRDLGNTVIVVEHDEDAILHADYVLDIGPRAGVHGGEVVACGTSNDIKNHPDSLTGQYLTKKLTIKPPMAVIKPKDWFYIYGITGNNLKNVNLKIPKGLLTCVTGVSGSGKSTLINNTLYRLLSKKLNRSNEQPYKFDSYKNIDLFDKVIKIDQSAIGKTPRSNPSTYTGIFTSLRELFAQTEEARLRGYKIGRFSFNVHGGRCEHCEGDGVIKVEMHFLADVFVQCDYCEGKRYNRETLEIKYKGKNIFEILKMTIENAQKMFANIPSIKRRLDTLMDVGLGYLTLGQSSTTLSGGEAQRIKLAKELSKMSKGNTIYILDEPTNGLHFHDINQLLGVLFKLREKGNTLVVIEHNLDVIKVADWIIDLGPEGGDAGGKIIAEGTIKEICKNKKSITGHFLSKKI